MAAAKEKAKADEAAEAKAEEEADDIRHYVQQAVVKRHLNAVHSVQVPNTVAENVKRNIGPHKELCKVAVLVRNSIGNTIEIVDKKIEGYKRDAEAGNAVAQFTYEGSTLSKPNIALLPYALLLPHSLLSPLPTPN